MTSSQLFACLRYADADTAITFLTALGFTERLVVRDQDDPTIVRHAQLRWRQTGGVMLGTDRDGGIGPRPGTGCIDLVVPTDDDVDATLARALEAGARQLDEVHEPPYGGRTVAVADHEGNIWNIDSYPGE